MGGGNIFPLQSPGTRRASSSARRRSAKSEGCKSNPHTPDSGCFQQRRHPQQEGLQLGLAGHLQRLLPPPPRALCTRGAATGWLGCNATMHQSLPQTAGGSVRKLTVFKQAATSCECLGHCRGSQRRRAKGPWKLLLLLLLPLLLRLLRQQQALLLDVKQLSQHHRHCMGQVQAGLAAPCRKADNDMSTPCLNFNAAWPGLAHDDQTEEARSSNP